MKMNSTINIQCTRGSDGVRAPCSTISVQQKKRKRRRGGKKRKRRAGARKTQSKGQILVKANLRIMYWNCGSLNERGVVCETVAYNYDVVCIQESKLGNYKKFHVDGFTPHYNRSGHGQVILVRETIQHSELDVTQWESNNFHLQAIKLTDQPISNIVNIYACNRAVNEEESSSQDSSSGAF